MTLGPPGRSEVRRDLLVLGLGAAALFLAFVGARDLWNPNEPTYAVAVVEMSRSGDWIVPTVNGRVFAEKPILYFWMALASAKIAGGISEFSLRIPSAAAGVLAVVLTYLLALPYAGRRRALLAAVFTATTYSVFWNARAVQMDILVAASTLAVILSVVRVLDHGAPPLGGWAVAGAAAGLGFLAKGPVALLCPALVLVPYLLATRRAGAVLSRGVLVGIGVFLAVAAPWFVAIAVRGEAGFLRELLFRQNVTRFLEPWDHQAPYWYYLREYWMDMAPWGWLVPFAVALPGRDRDERRLDLLAWIWIAAVIAFFSMSGSKRSAYILPIAPAVAVLAAGVMERLLDGTLPRARRVAAEGLIQAGGLAAAACGVFVLLKVVPRYPEVAFQGKAIGCLLLVGGASILAARLSRAKARVAAVAALFVLVLSLEVLAAVSVLPAANRYKSARSFCEEVTARVSAGQPLASYRFWTWRANYAYYTGRPIRNLESEDALAAYLGDGGPAFVIVEDERMDEARRVLGSREPLARAEIGRTTAYLFSNR